MASWTTKGEGSSSGSSWCWVDIDSGGEGGGGGGESLFLRDPLQDDVVIVLWL